MDLNSRLFDRIRVKPAQKQAPRAKHAPCSIPKCDSPGEFRAPMGRMREGQYLCFCLEHVKEYNASYNYFNGMSDEAVANYQREAIVGHRPTWTMGVNRAGKNFREDTVNPAGYSDPFGNFRSPHHRQPEKTKVRYGLAAMKALTTLGLDETADSVAIKTRYKELVKRLHPDANGGDRSTEDQLREIIQAYNYLKSIKIG